MGNDHSQLPELDIQEKAVEVTDFWSHHSASVHCGNVSSLSVFIGEPLISGSLWLKHTPLEKSSKNLMIYRHPCILKYISSWQKSSKFHLAVEDTKPLSHVLPSQSNLQICVGLHSVLKALCFLHDKAMASHNNVCVASIYVTKDGSWKLGGMEYLCKFGDLTCEYLAKTRSHRYEKAIDPNEDKNMQVNDRRDFIDLYAFGMLVQEVLKRKEGDIPSLTSFLDVCKNDLQHVDIILRPKFSTLLEHPFFNHDFITIHCFLTELPLKTDVEKTEFFMSLVDKLKTFDENTVGSQLTNLLLSRMVLLNKTAQTSFIPFILCPKGDSPTNSMGIFSTDTFKKYLIPKLLEIFCVRDAQIRLLLLHHFIHYLHCFSKEELQSQILPELLVGIKDTNDQLVAVTLRALADLVPILGSDTVIGGKRAKLFNDGRPIAHPVKRSKKNQRRTSTPFVTSETESASTDSLIEPVMELPERPSPDGEEDETSTEEVDVETEEDLENWEDWDINEDTRELTNNRNVNTISEDGQNSSAENDLENQLQNVQISIGTLNIAVKKKSLPDILELDIKNQKNLNKTEDFDFFQDMEPVIETSKFLVSNIDVEQSEDESSTKKLNLGVDRGENHEEGWGDLDWD